MKILFPYFLVLIMSILGVSGQTAADFVRDAQKAQFIGDTTEALRLYDKAIELRTQSAKAFILRGKLIGKTTKIQRKELYNTYLFDNQDYNKALADFDKAISLDTGSYLGYYVRGNLNMAYQNPELAITDFTNVLSRTDDTEIRCYSLNKRGLAKMQAEYYESASDDFYEALELAEHKFDIYNNIALLYRRIGNEYLAFDAIQNATRLAPDDLRTKNNLALLKAEFGEFESAIKLFEELLGVSEDPLFYNNRGYAYYQIKNYPIALKDINKSLELWEENAYAYRNRALIFLAQKKYKKACADLLKAEKYGFSKIYGDEIQELQNKYCW